MKNKSGFTLVEILVAMALFAIMMTTVNVMLFSTLRNSRKVSAIDIAKAEGSFAIKTMSDMIKYARRLTCGVDGTTNFLQVTRLNGNEIFYYWESSSSRVASKSALPSAPPGGNLFTYLTSANVRVTVPATCPGGVLFTCTATGDSVQICFNINVANPPSDVADNAMGTTGINFNSMITVRN